MLSLKYESKSDRGLDLAWLLKKVKALSSGSNPRDNLTNLIVLDLDDMAEMDRARVKLLK
ncbi:hypothetical protein Gotri_014419 [Gossypium trilobum]|uniref:Uncharacterized protein n=1 Tax=Gossypium trilobum TaxID=34281 RepID=A0A7J9DWN1_9ROSI|nr:hypothetical protein [Gossypium trilobum]